MVVLGRSLPDIDAGGGAFVFEFLGAFLLVLTVVHVTVKGVPEACSALAIGAALAVGVLIAGAASGGILNPALGIAFLLTGVIDANLLLAWLPYLVAPLAAGAVAALREHTWAPERNRRHKARDAARQALWKEVRP